MTCKGTPWPQHRRWIPTSERKSKQRSSVRKQPWLGHPLLRRPAIRECQRSPSIVAEQSIMAELRRLPMQQGREDWTSSSGGVFGTTPPEVPTPA